MHLEGTLRRETALELARAHGERPPLPYEYGDLDGFFAVYFPVARLMQTAGDFERVVIEHARHMAAVGIGRAEVSFNPALHDGTAWLAGLERGRARAWSELGVRIAWLVELTRGAETNAAAVDIALSTPGVVGLGLVGDETIRDPELAALVARARRGGLHLMAHAGQTGGPEVIREAVEELSAERIAHGVSAARDRSLCEVLIARDVCLCICPSSNRHIGLRPDYRALAGAGLALCVNTDDPAIVGTDLPAELDIAERLGLDRATLLSAAEGHRFDR